MIYPLKHWDKDLFYCKTRGIWWILCHTCENYLWRVDRQHVWAEMGPGHWGKIQWGEQRRGGEQAGGKLRKTPAGGEREGGQGWCGQQAHRWHGCEQRHVVQWQYLEQFKILYYRKGWIADVVLDCSTDRSVFILLCRGVVCQIPIIKVATKKQW